MSLAPPTVKCKLCGMTSSHLCDTPNASSEIQVIHNYRCASCGLVFVGNAVTNQQLGAAYGAMDGAKYYEEVGETTEGKFATALASLRQLQIDEKSNVIDIGTGRGDFLLYLKKAGFQSLSGHEIPGEDTTHLEENHIAVYKDYDFQAIPSATFDAATLLDVMEHVPDPHKVVQEVFRILRPNGVIYFHTPCVTFTDRLMHLLQKIPGIGRIARIWQRGRTSIFHLQNYTPDSLNLMLNRPGFKNVSVTRVNELSWPVRRYVQVYLCQQQGLPDIFSYILTPLLYPFLATSLLNSNKGIVVARKPAA